MLLQITGQCKINDSSCINVFKGLPLGGRVLVTFLLFNGGVFVFFSVENLNMGCNLHEKNALLEGVYKDNPFCPV